MSSRQVKQEKGKRSTGSAQISPTDVLVSNAGPPHSLWISVNIVPYYIGLCDARCNIFPPNRQSPLYPFQSCTPTEGPSYSKRYRFRASTILDAAPAILIDSPPECVLISRHFSDHLTVSDEMGFRKALAKHSVIRFGPLCED